MSLRVPALRRRGRRSGWFAGAIAFALAATCAAEGEVLPDWRIHGSNTLRASLYGTGGSEASSPYPFEDLMAYDEFTVNLERQFSPYESMQAEISGLFNVDDEYRAADRGFVPERLRFVWENGEEDTPYRLEVGDHFANFSFLTLQRSLKGIQVEWQPRSDVPGRQYSLIVTSGADEPDWLRMRLRKDHTSGASLLVHDERIGALSFNLVHNFRDGSTTAGTLDRSQLVASVALERSFEAGGQDLTLEGEYARFHGDHNGSTGTPNGQNQSEMGYFMQLAGRSKDIPLDYRARFEFYGQDFQPRGAVVTPDRKAVEGHVGWRFDSGIRARGRAQYFEDGVESATKLRTRTVGVNFAGPLLHRWYPDVTGSLDAFVQDAKNEGQTTDSFTKSLNVNLSKPLPRGWSGRLGLFLQKFEDDSAANADLLTRQLTLSADHALTLWGFDGVITPGMVVRSNRKGTGYSTDWNPTLAYRGQRGPHAVGVALGAITQDRDRSIGGADVDTYTANAEYSYTKAEHTIGAELNLFERDPDPGAQTDAFRFSAYWTYRFDRPPTTVARAVAPIAPGLAPEAAAVSASMLGLAPGASKSDVDAALAAAGITSVFPQAGLLVYEAPLLRDVLRRQRLVLEYAAGILDRSTLVIEFDDVGDRNTTAQTFEGIRQALVRELGPPTRTIERGAFSATLAADVNDQRFVRITEWKTAAGTVRFGIPRRLDRQVRMEVQHARRFPQPSDTLWSVEAVR